MASSAASTLSAVVNAAEYDQWNTGVNTCAIKFSLDGYVYVMADGNSNYVQYYLWKTGSGSAGDYEIRATYNGSNVDGFVNGTMDTWQALSTSRSWTRPSLYYEEKIGAATFEIRDASTLAVIASNDITLSCIYGTGIPP